MINIARREIDVRPIIGAVVVFLIIGSIIFGIYYFAIAKPAADALQSAKESALSQVASSLGTIGTDKAASAALTYTAQIQAAGSTSDVNAILNEVVVATQREQQRKTLLDEIAAATTGVFHTAADVPALASLRDTLTAGVNELTTIGQIQSYATTIDNQATTTWRNFFTEFVGAFGENVVMKQQNSSPTWWSMSKENALNYISTWTWETLRKITFLSTRYVQVPISDTVNRAPTVVAGSKVDVCYYDTSLENMNILYKDATVLDVFYSYTDIATIAWTLSYGTTSQSYSTNIWETIKAAAAGSSEAAAVGWSAYGSDVMNRATQADIINTAVNVIYTVEVPEETGTLILEYELHESATKTVVLMARTTG